MKIAEFLESEPGLDWKTKLTINTVDGTKLYKDDNIDLDNRDNIPFKDLYVDTAVIAYNFKTNTVGVGIVANTKEVIPDKDSKQ